MKYINYLGLLILLAINHASYAQGATTDIETQNVSEKKEKCGAWASRDGKTSYREWC